MSTFVNKVDRKGRVSLPAPFRNALSAANSPGVVTYPSLRVNALEGCSHARMEEMAGRLETLEQFSDEYESIANLFADAHELNFDGEGRILLPDALRDFAGITESAAFVGLGGTFQIWEPQAFEAAKQASRERARIKGTTLPPRMTAPPPGATA